MTEPVFHPRPASRTVVLALLCAALFSSWTGPARARDTTLLVLPMKALDGMGEDATALLTSTLVVEAGKVPGYTVSSMREVEGLLSTEQARQMASCDSTSCVLEVAGALNSDEVVLGQVGKVGSGLVWTLARVRARDGLQRARVVRTLPPGADAVMFLGLVPEMARELLVAGPTTAVRAMRAAGGAGLGVGAAAGAVGLLAAMAAGAVWLVFQVVPGLSRGLGLGMPLSLLVWGGTGGGAAVVLLGAALAGVGAAVLLTGFLMPANAAGGAP